MLGPLQGVKVVEITMFQQGPVAGMQLGDLGADVIKVEPKSFPGILVRRRRHGDVKHRNLGNTLKRYYWKWAMIGIK